MNNQTQSTCRIKSFAVKFPKLMLNGRLKSIQSISRKLSGNDEAKIIPIHATLAPQNSWNSDKNYRNSPNKFQS